MQLQTVLNDNAFQKCPWSCAVIVTVSFFLFYATSGLKDHWFLFLGFSLL